MHKEPSLRVAAILSLVVLTILLVGSILFYKERMLFSDAAYISFNAINSQELQIQVERYGSFITQIVPVVGSKLHLSLKTILVLYSASFNLFYLSVALLLFRFRRYGLVVLLALYFTLIVSDTYFWTNNEVHQGVAWMFLMFGSIPYLYDKLRNRRPFFIVLSLLIFIPLAVFAIYSHPLVMIPTVFLWMFLFLSKKEEFFTQKLSYLYAAVIVIICVLKYATSKNNGYDGNIMKNLLKSNLADVVATFTSGMADIFWKGLISNYYILPLLFIWGLTVLFKRRNYVVAVYTIFACLGYFIILCLTFSGGETLYIESEWMCLTILGTAAFTYYIVPTIPKQKVMLLFTVIFIVRLGYICHSAPKFTARLETINNILTEMKQKALTKVVVPKKENRLDEKLIFSWALPIETMYASILNNEDTIRTFVSMDDSEIKRILPESSTTNIILPFGVPHYKMLSRTYFPVDTTKPYSILPYDEFFDH